MKLNLKLTSGISLLAIATMILLISSPAVAIPTSPSLNTSHTYDTTPNVELANVVAGIDQAVYASIFTFGGTDGSAIPVDTSASAFTSANSWFVASISQSGFDSYLQRAPSPVFAPDGLSLHITYPGSMSNNAATSSALDAASALSTEYGVTLDLIEVNLVTKSFTFWANGSDTATVESAVAGDVTALGTAGFSALLDSSTITGSPVHWAGYGARTLGGSDVAQFGAGWVDTDGLTDEGSGVYQLSSNNIFGGDIDPNTATAQSLSRLTFTVPYPIEPTTGGISPSTSNPLPHVTGIAQWDLRHPIASYGIESGTDHSDYYMNYKLKTSTSFPNIQNKFTIDQDKLNTQGILEGTFNLTNIGDEVAENIDVYFPLGPDFGKIMDVDRTIYEIDSAEYELDPAANVQYSLVTTGSVSGVLLNEQILDFSGWYNHISNASRADWVDQPEAVIAPAIDIGIETAEVKITSTDGFPQFLLDYLGSLSISAASPSELLSAAQNIVPDLVNTTKNNILDTYYVEKPLFTVNSGDFTIENIPYQVSRDQRKNYYFMTANVASLAAGASQTLQFNIDDIPTVSGTFQFIDYEVTSAAEELDSLPSATIVSSEENWYNVMQYLLEKNEYDGRLLSFGFEGDVSFGLDDFGINDYHSQQYVSQGALVRYENAQNYPFFSLSNGQNIQFGDDEAVVSAALSLDKQVYYPSDNQIITVDLNNTGDLPAQNLKVHLYHASLGRDWRFERASKITTLDVGTLAAGAEQTVTHTTTANSFVGYSPVYAYVTFDSDVGQGSAPLTDYLDRGITEFQAAGETSHITTSTLTGALLLPSPGDVGLNPTIKEPKIDISKTIGEPDENNELDVSYTIENTGEADTTVYFRQGYATDDLELVESSDIDAIKIANTYENYNYGFVAYRDIQLAPGDSVTVTLTFEIISESAAIWPAGAYFTIAGESTLGDSADTGSTTTVSSSLLGLSAGSEAQQDSQKSANENSASSSYSASSSVGASVNTNVNTDDTNTVDGFIGYDAVGFLALMAVPLTLASFYRKRK